MNFLTPWAEREMRTFLFRALLTFIFLMVSVYVATHSYAQQRLGIAAIVNDEVISLFDLEERVSLAIVSTNQKNTPETRREIAHQVLKQLIDEKLQFQESKRLGATISRGEIEKAYKEVERRNGLAPGKLEEILNLNGLDRLVVLEQIEAQLAWDKTIGQTLGSQIIIGNEEVDEIIEEIKASKGKPEYLVSEIALSVDNPDAVGNVLNLANKLINELQRGARFSSLARNFSQSASAATGGDLGWIRQGQLNKELDTALTALKDGNLSQPIRTVSGYSILYKRKSRIGRGLVSSDEKVTLQQAFFDLPPAATDIDVQTAMEKAGALSGQANNCADFEQLAKGTGSALSGSLGVVKTIDLPVITRNAISGLAIGLASTPIRSENGIAVLMVCERDGTDALKSVRANIERRLIDERLDIAARRHLRDLRRSAFIDIRL